MDSILNKILSNISEWKSRKGFVLLICAGIVVSLILGITISLLTVSIFLVGIILWSILWCIGSGRIIFPSNKKTIIFSFKVDNEGKKNYERIFNNLKEKLDELKISKDVRIIIAGPDVFNHNHDCAVKYQRRHNADMVVWGKSEYGNLESKKLLKFEVHHTCSISPTLNEKLQLFFTDMAVIFQRRTWTVNDINELADIKVVADDFLETCLFIIGIYYFDEIEFEKAIKIFENILPVLEKKAQISSDEVRKLQAGRVRTLLIDLYFLLAQVAHSENNNDKAIPLLLRILPSAGNKIPVLMVLARSYYFKGDIFNAQKCTNQIRSLDKKHPAVLFNNAFFGILQKNYERVRFWYEEILRMDAIKDVNVTDLIAFLDDEYRKLPSEHAFLYALGIVNGYIDPKTRKNDLLRFMKLTKSRNEYLVLRLRAQELLHLIK